MFTLKSKHIADYPDICLHFYDNSLNFAARRRLKNRDEKDWHDAADNRGWHGKRLAGQVTGKL